MSAHISMGEAHVSFKSKTSCFGVVEGISKSHREHLFTGKTSCFTFKGDIGMY